MLKAVAVPWSPGVQAYRKFVARNGLKVQRHRHANTDVRLPLDGGWRDDEVVGVVAHQVNLKNAVGPLKVQGWCFINKIHKHTRGAGVHLCDDPAWHAEGKSLVLVDGSHTTQGFHCLRLGAQCGCLSHAESFFPVRQLKLGTPPLPRPGQQSSKTASTLMLSELCPAEHMKSKLRSCQR